MDHLTIRKWLVTGVSEPKKTYITGINFTNWERLRKKTGLLTYEDRGMILQVVNLHVSLQLKKGPFVLSSMMICTHPVTK